MNQKKAKALRRMARAEMAANPNSVERELLVATIRGHDRVINEPLSVRAMHQHLKRAYKQFDAGPR